MKPKPLKTSYQEEFQGYDRSKFLNDAIAGLMAAFISIPLGLSFAISSHAVPVAGVLSFMIGTLFFSLLSANPFQVQGSAALSVGILATISLTYGEEAIYWTGILIAVCMLLLWGFRLGKYIERVPEGVIRGLTMGIGYIIIKNQVVSIAQSKPPLWLVGILVGTLIFLFAYPRKWEKVLPGGVIVTLVFLVANGVGQGFLPGPGSVVWQWNPMSVSFAAALTVKEWIHLFFWAASLTLLFVMKDFSGGLMGQKRANRKFQGNRELLLLAVINLTMPLFRALPCTGAITVTQVSYKYKQTTRVTGLFMAFFLAVALFLLPRYVGLIPIVTLWSILIFTGIGMLNLPMIKEFAVHPKRNLLPLVTFLLIVVFNMSVGMVGGLVLAFILSKKPHFVDTGD